MQPLYVQVKYKIIIHLSTCVYSHSHSFICTIQCRNHLVLTWISKNVSIIGSQRSCTIKSKFFFMTTYGLLCTLSLYKNTFVVASTLLKMGCYITPLGHYTILVIKKLQRVVLITGMAQCPRGVMQHPIFNSELVIYNCSSFNMYQFLRRCILPETVWRLQTLPQMLL